MKSRIAIFEGHRPPRRSKRYGAPLFENPRMRGYGFDPRMMPRGMGFDPRTMPQGMGAPLFENPGLGSYGRRGYYVPPLYARSSYGPATESGRRVRKLKRKGYRVKKGRNTKSQVRFKKAAKRCARKARGRNARKGAYQSCMRQALRKKRSRR
jgi:hypothetical protein